MICGNYVGIRDGVTGRDNNADRHAQNSIDHDMRLTQQATSNRLSRLRKQYLSPAQHNCHHFLQWWQHESHFKEIHFIWHKRITFLCIGKLAICTFFISHHKNKTRAKEHTFLWKEKTNTITLTDKRPLKVCTGHRFLCKTHLALSRRIRRPPCLASNSAASLWR